jgi:hypothetical protein
VEAQQGVQARCFAELDAFSRFLATTAALKCGMWVLMCVSYVSCVYGRYRTAVLWMRSLSMCN